MKKIALFLFLTTAVSLANAQSAKQAAKIDLKNDQRSTRWIDFDFYNGNQIFLKGKVNGYDAVIQLINGLGNSMLEKTFATSISAGSASGYSKPTAIIEVQLGDLTLKEVTAEITPSGSSGHTRNLILSDDLFNNVIVDIDFARHRLAFRDPVAFKVPKGVTVMPLLMTGDAPSVPVSVDGAPPVNFELFLGDPVPITVYQAFCQAHGLLHRKTSVRLGGGKTHPIEAIATVDSVRFAGINFVNVPGVFPTDSVRGSTSTLVSGNIGMEMLSRFRLIMDYSHSKLYTMPNSKMAKTSFLKDRSGLFLVEKDGDYAVEFVAPGSPAEKAGFKPGDKIMQINQMPVRSWLGKAWQKPSLGSLQQTSPGMDFIFTMSDGSIREFHAADFF